MTDHQLLPPVIQYLLGQGPLDGCYYPDFPDNGEKYKRRYWWRKALLEAFETRAALSGGPEGWQPIDENTPKNDTVILLYFGNQDKYRDPNVPFVWVAQYGWAEYPDGIEKQTWIDYMDAKPLGDDPTHWMPLPLPPKPTRGNSETV